jgi:hypothetical protein
MHLEILHTLALISKALGIKYQGRFKKKNNGAFVELNGHYYLFEGIYSSS